MVQRPYVPIWTLVKDERSEAVAFAGVMPHPPRCLADSFVARTITPWNRDHFGPFTSGDGTITSSPDATVISTPMVNGDRSGHSEATKVPSAPKPATAPTMTDTKVRRCITASMPASRAARQAH